MNECTLKLLTSIITLAWANQRCFQQIARTLSSEVFSNTCGLVQFGITTVIALTQVLNHARLHIVEQPILTVG